MLTELNKLFIEKLQSLTPDLWLYIFLAVVAVAFAVALIVGLVTGDLKTSKSLMSRAISQPAATVAVMKQMPAGIKRQYKRARMANVKPSDFVSQTECVELPYKHSLISKVWLVTLVATVICAGMAFAVGGVWLSQANVEGNDSAVLFNAPYLMLFMVLLVGGILSAVGGIIGKAVHSGAVKVYNNFALVIDGDVKTRASAETQSSAAPASGFAFDKSSEPGVTANAYAEADEAPVVREYVEPETAYAEPVRTLDDEQTGYAQAEAEPVRFADEQPQFVRPEENNVEFVSVEPVRNEEEIIVEQENAEAAARAQAQAAAEAAARAQAEAAAQAQAQAAAEAAARAQAEAAAQAQAQAAAEAAARAQAEAAAQAQAQAAAQAAAQAQAQAAAQAQAQPAGSSSVDDVIARIEKIDKEGAPRETMREVATLLQKERAKPENKTPEQQKRLNEALSKLLKAMSAANRK